MLQEAESDLQKPAHEVKLAFSSYSATALQRKEPESAYLCCMLVPFPHTEHLFTFFMLKAWQEVVFVMMWVTAAL